MPLALLVALAGSLVIHAAALFLPDVDLSPAPEPPTINAELLPPPPKPAAPSEGRKPAEQPVPKAPAESSRNRAPKPQAPAVAQGAPVAPEPEQQPAPVSEPTHAPQAEEKPEAEKPSTPPAPVEPQLPSRGYIRFAIHKGSEGLLVGRAEHRWEFADGHYRLLGVTETVGLAALIKPIRVELESRGELTATGLQPESFTTRRNGSETNENAAFDWSVHQVTLGRDGSHRDLGVGAQDLLSFHYQFSYLPKPEAGAVMGVATGKKFENYRFEPVGQEEVSTPAGHFRTLHVRVRNDTTTELWLALDHRLVPVKIRHTDKKGESFEQIATEIGM